MKDEKEKKGGAPMSADTRDRESYLRGLLWHAIHKTHPLSPSACTPCEQIDKELTEYVKPPKAIRARQEGS